ncbi:lambda-crystallin [Eurytemora carolleeae]|uniref:lambda-crystallin n=1 Tax=Eurytemora carolleeae TaxID=1294199 RepID=UPI000C76F968|nr:lambda-crystallin [Eurytemora carolleeae]|eukprot:XP_023332864.1 lambda-crystallin-like [Eurytemora affinis]
MFQKSLRMSGKGSVGIVGSGLIGKSWAMIFASVGYEVKLFDVEPSQVSTALENIKSELLEFEEAGTLRGTLPAVEQGKLITGTSSLKDCVQDAIYIQECVPENLELKIKVWTEIDGLVDETTILGSSTSCIVPSLISEKLKNRERFIVAHPCNPPYHTPMVELVPAPWTNQETRDTTRELMSAIGQGPVSLSRELPGFVLNRIQYALLNECWRLIRDGIVSPQDLDVVMKDGMGMRYALMGPMETIHLNADGTQNYCDRYGETIFNVSSDSGPVPTGWKQESEADRAEVAALHAALCETVPLEKLYERRVWRDKGLAALGKLKRDLAKSAKDE